MKLRYFVIDAGGLLRKARRRTVHDLWDGSHSADALVGCPAGKELRLVSVVCDDDLQPQKVYLLRLPLRDGVFTEESRLTLRLFARRDCITSEELVQHHTDGWPTDFFRQLAVALDVPMVCLDVPLGVGGPLLLAAALRLTPRQAVRHLR